MTAGDTASASAHETGRITVAADPPYDVWVGHGLLGDLGRHLPATLRARRAAVITTAQVERHHSAPVVAALASAGVEVHRRVVPDGETAKSLTVLGELYDWLASILLARDDVVVALGGGVVTDLSGFLAATWHRGVPVVQLPTTLLAQVDAAIGGKTGINLTAGKNLVGAFHQPAVMGADTATLQTLPPRELRAGLAEIIKCGFISDPQILDLVERDPSSALDPSATVLVELVHRAVMVKARVVAVDAHERGERALLNYGHTLGHAIETLTGYRRYRHGEAVALGMRFAALVAAFAGTASPDLPERTTRLLQSVGLPTICEPLDPDAVWAVMARDKKVRDGVRMVLCDRPGSTHLVDAPPRPVLERALAELTAA
ncbi:MAG TPA: 3-dehydroquinate synthase [Euzebyales bacterium]|nr:3-dehydroquinate synthase [Euzebyales bacterium]